MGRPSPGGTDGQFYTRVFSVCGHTPECVSVPALGHLVYVDGVRNDRVVCCSMGI